MDNTLYYGENLDILRRYIPDNSIDLIYLDPPFKSDQTYNILFKEKNGTESAAQIKVFEDTWHWDKKAEETYIEITEKAPQRAADLIIALRSFLGSNDLMAYLVMMAIRLVELHRVLKDTGSIYLHCDPAAGHYLKILIDSVFGPDNFISEIIWRRTGAHNKTTRYAPIHDIIFFYSKTKNRIWNYPIRSYMKEHVDEHFIKDEYGYKTKYYGNVLTGPGLRKGESGKPWRGFDPSAKGRHWAIPGKLLEDIEEDTKGLAQHQKFDLLYKLGFIKIIPGHAWPIYERYLKPDEGQPVADIWAFQPYTQHTVFDTDKGIDEDVRWLSPRDQERLGYPTQKPEGILERIISASSKKGGVVLDPFCGCGTTITVAEKLKRKWIGIDVTHLAISLMRHRLMDTFGDKVKYEVIGEPVDLKGAGALAKQDPYQFEWWALGLVAARPAESEKRKGKDKGIDGYIYFYDEPKKTKKIFIQVKSGHVNPAQIRDLRGVIEREKAQIGVFITFQEPTQGMRTEAVSAGFYRSPGWNKDYSRMQILTIRELLEGKEIDYPPKTSITFKKAKKHEAEEHEQLILDKNKK